MNQKSVISYPSIFVDSNAADLYSQLPWLQTDFGTDQ